mmetsp:Transcript_74106/g.191144  ORF Transcript_74106/g.191144 Transcript_74106/m.191144 type:complete len:242 (+) Transcript_74106:727-1452(+)
MWLVMHEAAIHAPVGDSGATVVGDRVFADLGAVRRVQPSHPRRPILLSPHHHLRVLEGPATVVQLPDSSAIRGGHGVTDRALRPVRRQAHRHLAGCERLRRRKAGRRQRRPERAPGDRRWRWWCRRKRRRGGCRSCCKRLRHPCPSWCPWRHSWRWRRRLCRRHRRRHWRLRWRRWELVVGDSVQGPRPCSCGGHASQSDRRSNALNLVANRLCIQQGVQRRWSREPCLIGNSSRLWPPTP